MTDPKTFATADGRAWPYVAGVTDPKGPEEWPGGWRAEKEGPGAGTNPAGRLLSLAINPAAPQPGT